MLHGLERMMMMIILPGDNVNCTERQVSNMENESMYL